MPWMELCLGVAVLYSLIATLLLIGSRETRDMANCFTVTMPFDEKTRLIENLKSQAEDDKREIATLTEWLADMEGKFRNVISEAVADRQFVKDVSRAVERRQNREQEMQDVVPQAADQSTHSDYDQVGRGNLDHSR